MEISRERRREIVNALRKGTVPQRGLDFFAVGLSRFEPAIVEELAEVAGKDDRVDWLQKDLKTDELQSPLGPSILRVTLSGDSPEDVQLILNEVGKAYLKEFVANEKKKLISRKEQLEENYRSCADTLRKKRQKLRSRKEDLGLDDEDELARTIHGSGTPAG